MEVKKKKARDYYYKKILEENINKTIRVRHIIKNRDKQNKVYYIIVDDKANKYHYYGNANFDAMSFIYNKTSVRCRKINEITRWIV